MIVCFCKDKKSSICLLGLSKKLDESVFVKGKYTKLFIGTHYIKPTFNRNTLYYTHSPQGFPGI